MEIANYGHVIFGIQNLLIRQKSLRESTWFRSDIQVEDCSISHESVVDNTALQNKCVILARYFATTIVRDYPSLRKLM